MSQDSRKRHQEPSDRNTSPEESTSPTAAAGLDRQGVILGGAGAFGILETLGSDEEGGNGSGTDEQNFSDEEGFEDEILDSEVRNINIYRFNKLYFLSC